MTRIRSREDLTDSDIYFLSRCDLCGTVFNVINTGRVSEGFLMCDFCVKVENYRKTGEAIKI